MSDRLTAKKLEGLRRLLKERDTAAWGAYALDNLNAFANALPALLDAAEENKRLREALQEIEFARTKGPHLGAKEGLTAALDLLHKVRATARTALNPEKVS